MNDPLTDLSKYGVAVWLDDLSRDRLTTGSLVGLAGRDRVAGVTSNPSILAKAITGTGVCGPQVRDPAARDATRARLGHQLAALLRQPPRRERS